MSENENDVDPERKIDSASKRVYPGLTLWIVLDIPITCLSTVETDLMKMILNSGLDVMSCKPIRSRGKQGSLEVYTASLCQCLNDYNNSYMKELAKYSSEHVASLAAFYQFRMKDDTDLHFKPEFGTNVVKITICKTCPVATAREFVSGLESIKYTQFQYDLVNNVDMETPNNQRHENTPIQVSPGNKLLVAIKAIEKLMRDLAYSLFRYREIHYNIG